LQGSCRSDVIRRPLRSRRWLPQEFSGRFNGAKQSLDALAQSGIASTSLVEVGRPFIARQLLRGTKDSDLAIERFCHGTHTYALPNNAQKHAKTRKISRIHPQRLGWVVCRTN
jgi:hypothetical protein